MADNSLELSGSMVRDYLDKSRSREEFTGVDSKDWENALGPNAEFNGTLVVEDNVRLEGKFQGELVTRGTVHIVPGAEVNANIQAGFAAVAGTYKGELRCEHRIDLLASCRAKGKLVTDGLTMESGAIFDGQVEMTKKSRPRYSDDSKA